VRHDRVEGVLCDRRSADRTWEFSLAPYFNPLTKLADTLTGSLGPYADVIGKQPREVRVDLLNALSLFHHSAPETMKYVFEVLDVFGILHLPARLACRLLLSPKYLFRGPNPTKRWPKGKATSRYGRHLKWKPWLWFDIEELERITGIINDAAPDDVLKFRDAHLDAARLVAVVVSLCLSSICSAMVAVLTYVGSATRPSRADIAVAPQTRRDALGRAGFPQRRAHLGSFARVFHVRAAARAGPLDTARADSNVAGAHRH
jgi:hypothetical protein